MSGKSKETAAGRSVVRLLKGGVALGAMMVMSSAAQAQCTAAGFAPGFAELVGSFNQVAASSAVNTVLSAVNTSNTAFLTQSTAFVGAPPNPAPNQQGGGVWGRAIGGQVDTENTSTATASIAGIGIPGSITCNTTTRTDFAGVQAGADVGRFNVNGWNLHYGGTAGYLSSKAKDKTAGAGSFTNDIDIPFAGIYAAATRGGFFVDGQFRVDWLQNTLNDPNITTGVGVFDQPLNARTWSFAANVGYNHGFANNWFIEPSAGVIWSRTEVDPFNYSGTLVLANSTGISPPGTLQINDIESILGRASVRIGTVFQSGNWLVSPFATASVYHDFGDDITSTFTTNFASAGIPFADFTGNITTTNLGTWGQFALGAAFQLPGTGWASYVRGDYRVGENIDGWSLNGGVRYHFLPAPVVAGKMPTKGPAIPVVTAVNWTGFYIGGSLGGIFAEENVTYPGVNLEEDPRVAGVFAGGQFGYNWQAIGSKWVFGLEADAGFSNANGGKSCDGGGALTFYFSCEGEISWMATGTAKVGYALAERGYVYVKGGVAAGEVTFSSRCNTGSQPTILIGLLGCPVTSDSATAVGWTAGWGGEFALTDNWSARSETKYFDLGDVTLSHPVFGGGFATPNVQTDGWISTIGVNYRFPVRRM